MSRERRRAALRRGARRAAAPAGAQDGPRRRGRRAHRARRRPRRPPRGVERAARAVANSPLVKTALHGGDPNWGRIAQAVGAALPGAAPLPLDIAIEGVQVCAARRGAFRYDGARSRRRCAATRSSTWSACPATASRPRCSSPTSGTSTSGSTPSTRHRCATSRHSSRRCPTSASSTADGGHQVRRRGDGGPGAARGVRARRGAPQVRRDEPDRRPRRRARTSPRTWSA